VVNLVVLACVLRATTKKKDVNFLEEKVHPSRENSGYAYEFAHPWKKSCGHPWMDHVVHINVAKNIVYVTGQIDSICRPD